MVKGGPKGSAKTEGKVKIAMKVISKQKKALKGCTSGPSVMGALNLMKLEGSTLDDKVKAFRNLMQEQDKAKVKIVELRKHFTPNEMSALW